MKNAFAHNAFAASGGISQTAADARYVLKAAGSFTGLTGAGFRDTSAAFDVTQTFTSSTALDGARSITWDVKNASHSLKFTAASIVTFPAGTNTLLGSAVANTITANGAASTPALLGTGTIFSGGTATTTKPYWLIEPSGTTSTDWGTSGTLFGANGPSGFVGNLMDLQLNGVSKFKVNYQGTLIAIGAITASSTITAPQYQTSINNGYIQFGTQSYIQNSSDGVIGIYNNAGTSFGRLLFGGTTSSFPALKRSAAQIHCRAADDSAYAQFDALGYSVGGVAGVSGTITAASTVTVVNGIVTVIA